jgi:hypothetical protein
MSQLLYKNVLPKIKETLSIIWHTKKLRYTILSFSLFPFFMNSFMWEFAAQLGLYQGTPIVIYMEQDPATQAFEEDEDVKLWAQFEFFEQRNLKMYRISNIYLLEYTPPYFLKSVQDPHISKYYCLHLGYHIQNQDKKKWQTLSLHGKSVPCLIYPKGNHSLTTKFAAMLSGNKTGKATLYMDKDFAEILNLPIDTSIASYIDPKSKREHIRIKPVHIKLIGEGFVSFDMQPTKNERLRYKYAETITISIHKDTISKIDFDHSSQN